MTLIVLFNLRDAAAEASYEQWALTVDMPNVRRLPSVDGFRVYKSSGILGSEAPAPYRYVEVIEILDMDALFQDISTETMQEISRQFQGFADNPCFMVTQSLD